MATRGGSVHVATTRRHYKDKTYETHLLRRSYREDGKVKSETVGNLSHLPAEVIEIIRRALKGETFVAASGAFEIERSLPHGHVAAVAAMAAKLGLPKLLGPAGRKRDLALALIVARVVRPGSKLATTRWWRAWSPGARRGRLSARARDHAFFLRDRAAWAGRAWPPSRRPRRRGRGARSARSRRRPTPPRRSPP